MRYVDAVPGEFLDFKSWETTLQCGKLYNSGSKRATRNASPRLKHSLNFVKPGSASTLCEVKTIGFSIMGPIRIPPNPKNFVSWTADKFRAPKRVALFPKTKGSSRVSNFGQEPSRDSKGPLMCLHDAESQGLGLSDKSWRLNNRLRIYINIYNVIILQHMSSVLLGRHYHL